MTICMGGTTNCILVEATGKDAEGKNGEAGKTFCRLILLCPAPGGNMLSPPSTFKVSACQTVTPPAPSLDSTVTSRPGKAGDLVLSSLTSCLLSFHTPHSSAAGLSFLPAPHYMVFSLLFLPSDTLFPLSALLPDNSCCLPKTQFRKHLFQKATLTLARQ